MAGRLTTGVNMSWRKHIIVVLAKNENHAREQVSELFSGHDHLLMSGEWRFVPVDGDEDSRTAIPLSEYRPKLMEWLKSHEDNRSTPHELAQEFLNEATKKLSQGESIDDCAFEYLMAGGLLMQLLHREYSYYNYESRDYSVPETDTVPNCYDRDNHRQVEMSYWVVFTYTHL
jgi:hypothetical protein